MLAQSDESLETRNTVVLMGMIHGNHLNSEQYDLEHIKSLIRRIRPDYVFCEIPPDRVALASRQFRETGKINEPRVKVFPEYVGALYPLTEELDFEIVPCAGWTKSMSDHRRAKLNELQSTHRAQYEEMQKAQSAAEKKIDTEGGNDNPEFIHTDRFDELVKSGMEPYNRHFNDILGPGGWDNINKAHYGLIEKNLEKYQNDGKTILIMFGSWHKYWFKDQLRKRDDMGFEHLEAVIQALSDHRDSAQ